MSEHADAGSLADRLEASLALIGDGDWTPQDALAAEAVSVLRALAGTRETAQPYPPDDVYVPKATVTWGDVRAAQAAPSEPEIATEESTSAGVSPSEAGRSAVSGSLGAAALPPPVESFLDEEDLAVMAMDDEPATEPPPEAKSEEQGAANRFRHVAAAILALFGPRAWANRLLALTFCVPAIPYMWLRDEQHFARGTLKVLLTGRGRPGRMRPASKLAAVVPAGDAGQ